MTNGDQENTMSDRYRELKAAIVIRFKTTIQFTVDRGGDGQPNIDWRMRFSTAAQMYIPRIVLLIVAGGATSSLF